MKRKGIETEYSGHLFRSRLEARWAAFFDLIGWSWNYEPIDADGYIPDFLIVGDRPLMVEIRPDLFLGDYTNTAIGVEDKLKGHWDRDVAVFGMLPLPEFEDYQWSGSHPAACLLGEADLWESANLNAGPITWLWEPGGWHRCGECGQLAVFHTVQSFVGRPCGHYDGDHYLGRVNADDINEAWGQAHRATRWTKDPL